MGEVAGSSPAWSTRYAARAVGSKSGRSIVVVYTLRVRKVRVRFSAPRQENAECEYGNGKPPFRRNPAARRLWAYSKAVLRVIRIDEAGVRLPVGPRGLVYNSPDENLFRRRIW